MAALCLKGSSAQTQETALLLEDQMLKLMWKTEDVSSVSFALQAQTTATSFISLLPLFLQGEKRLLWSSGRPQLTLKDIRSRLSEAVADPTWRLSWVQRHLYWDKFKGVNKTLSFMATIWFHWLFSCISAGWCEGRWVGSCRAEPVLHCAACSATCWSLTFKGALMTF